MLQKEKLELMKVEELREICKERGISTYKNSKRMNKTQLIEALMESQPVKKEAKKSDGKKPDKKVVKETNKKTEPAEPVLDEEELAARKERKMKYIEEATVGTLIAFQLPSEKVISAMITRKSTKKRKFKVETKYGAEFIVFFDDILWVKTNKRWPKGIYQLFKKNLTEVVSENEEDVSDAACS